MLSLACAGAFEFDDGVDKAALLAHLAGCMRKLDARAIRISLDSVSFSGGPFRLVSNWNILVPFDHGELVVDEVTHEVRYRLSFRFLVFAVTALVGFAGVSEWYAGNHDPVILLFVAFGWLFLVGGNLMTGIPRFERFLRNAIDSLPVRTQSLGR